VRFKVLARPVTLSFAILVARFSSSSSRSRYRSALIGDRIVRRSDVSLSFQRIARGRTRNLHSAPLHGTLIAIILPACALAHARAPYFRSRRVVTFAAADLCRAVHFRIHAAPRYVSFIARLIKSVYVRAPYLAAIHDRAIFRNGSHPGVVGGCFIRGRCIARAGRARGWNGVAVAAGIDDNY